MSGGIPTGGPGSNYRVSTDVAPTMTYVTPQVPKELLDQWGFPKGLDNVNPKYVDLNESQEKYIRNLPNVTRESLKDIASLAVDAVYNKPDAANPTLQSRWGDFVADATAHYGQQVDVAALVQYVLREAYMSTSQDLMFFAEKTKFYNDMKKAVREELTSTLQYLSQPQIATLPDDSSLPQPYQKENFSDVWAPGISASGTEAAPGVPRQTRDATASLSAFSPSSVSDLKTTTAVTTPDGKTIKLTAEQIGMIQSTNPLIFKDIPTADARNTAKQNTYKANMAHVMAFLSNPPQQESALLAIATTVFDRMQDSNGLDHINFYQNSKGEWLVSADQNNEGLATMVFQPKISAEDKKISGFNATYIHGHDPLVDEFDINLDDKGKMTTVNSGDDFSFSGDSRFTVGGYTIVMETAPINNTGAPVTSNMYVFLGPQGGTPDIARTDMIGSKAAPSATSKDKTEDQIMADLFGGKENAEDAVNLEKGLTGGEFYMQANGEWAIYQDGAYKDINSVSFDGKDGRTETGLISTNDKLLGGQLNPQNYCYTKGELEAYKDTLEQKLQTLGDDAQLAQMDLQNILQRQQQLIQLMSNISKMLNDTAMNIIRKIG